MSLRLREILLKIFEIVSFFVHVTKYGRLIWWSVKILNTCYKHVWLDGHVQEKSMAGHLMSGIEVCGILIW